MNGEPYDCFTQAWIDAAETHGGKLKRRQRAKYLRHGSKYRKKQLFDRASDPEKFVKRAAEQRVRHADRIAREKIAWERKFKEEHPEKHKARRKAIEAKRTKAGKNAARSARRNAAKKQRSVTWADKEHMNLFYEVAAVLWEVTGEEHHIDHIDPLRGENISGLHVPENLQILTAHDNRVKINKWAA